ncbi:MAG: adenylate/guanylate cyclase domain-containing protein [Candidatus Binatia bacterium]
MASEEYPVIAPPKTVERRLAAIFSADVAGYSRLMGEDEVATVRTLTTYREVMSAFIRQHRGRVVDSPGDNILAEFSSVIDALQCAVEIQQELRARNAELPPPRRMEFRIGINLGDVIVESERIYGDGVNIAARLESLADAGGVCISGTVYDQVENKLALEYESLGEQAVKNIAKPVRAYRIQGTPKRPSVSFSPTRKEEPSAFQTPAFSFPDKPSIAVLPFVNMSSDPEQEYFSDGITEDIITDLSKLSGLFVISRNSVLTYKGKAIKPEQVSMDLGVRYVLEGSIRKAGARVRITAQLIDAPTGYHLWAERYDRNLEDIFALQDEVTKKIVDALEIKLTEGEQRLLGRPLTTNVEAYDCYLRGLDFHMRSMQAANRTAQQLFTRAIELDPQFATAHACLGWVYFEQWTVGWSNDPQTLEYAFAAAQKAIAANPLLSDGHRLLGIVYLWKKQHDLAAAEMERALVLDPNRADTYSAFADVCNFSGKPENSPSLVEKAMRLNPQYPNWYLWDLGHAYYLLRQYEEAIAIFKRALTRNPDFIPAHGFLAIIYGETGSAQEARTSGGMLQKLGPGFSLATLQQRLPYKDPAVLERVLHAARKAGLE